MSQGWASMMSLLSAHLEQIELCSATILDLPFESSKIFTNALLQAHDITALIRDTEAHERALFKFGESADARVLRNAKEVTGLRNTFFGVNGTVLDGAGGQQQPKKGSAVAAVLGGDAAQRLRRERARADVEVTGRQNSDLDIKLLLDSAEKLCGVYPITGASERIAQLRSRYNKAMASVERYERLVAEQSSLLRTLSRRTSFTADDDEDLNYTQSGPNGTVPVTREDLRREEEGIKELELKKRALEERITGMEKDLGGLLR